MPAKDAWRARVSELVARPSWVMDGNYASTFDIRVPRATTVIWLDVPRWTLPAAGHLARPAPFRTAAAGSSVRIVPNVLISSFMRWIWNYPRRIGRAKTKRMLKRLRPDQQAYIVRTRADIATLESRLLPTSEAA